MRMPERYGAAVDVRLLPRRLKFALIVKRGDGVRLVQLPEDRQTALRRQIGVHHDDDNRKRRRHLSWGSPIGGPHIGVLHAQRERAFAERLTGAMLPRMAAAPALGLGRAKLTRSKRCVISAGMKRVRAAKILRSPLLAC